MKTKKAFVRKEIDKIIRKEFSCFIMDKTMIVPPGTLCYRVVNQENIDNKRYFLVVNFGDSYWDKFTFECVWLSDAGTDLPSMWPEDTASSEGCLRFGFLYPGAINGYDFWWEIGEGEINEDSQRHLQQVIFDAVSKIRQYIIPFFQEMIALHNLHKSSLLLSQIDEKLKNF